MVKSFSIVYIYNHLLCVIHVDMKMNSNHRCENEVINKSPGIFSRKVTKNKKHENGDVVMDMSLLICLRLVCSWLGRIGTSTIWSLQISNPQRNRSLKVTSAHVCSTFCAVKKCDRCRSNNPQEMLVDCPTWHFSIGVMVKCWSIAQLGIFPQTPKHQNVLLFDFGRNWGIDQTWAPQVRAW